MLIVLFLVSHFYFLFVPCGGLSWLPVSFLLHVKYTLSYCIISYDSTINIVLIIIIIRWFSILHDIWIRTFVGGKCALQNAILLLAGFVNLQLLFVSNKYRV